MEHDSGRQMAGDCFASEMQLMRSSLQPETVLFKRSKTPSLLQSV